MSGLIRTVAPVAGFMLGGPVGAAIGGAAGAAIGGGNSKDILKGAALSGIGGAVGAGVGPTIAGHIGSAAASGVLAGGAIGSMYGGKIGNKSSNSKNYQYSATSSFKDLKSKSEKTVDSIFKQENISYQGDSYSSAINDLINQSKKKSSIFDIPKSKRKRKTFGKQGAIMMSDKDNY